MRKQFCDALVARSANPDMLFLTGDLGFMALEALQKALGQRFINAGLAEQNMMSVAAALAAVPIRSSAACDSERDSKLRDLASTPLAISSHLRNFSNASAV